MGLKLFSDDKHVPPNPHPYRFTVLHEYFKNGYLVLTVRYPDATTFEGKKLLVYYGFTTSKELLQYTAGKLDPHFIDGSTSPIARFPPTISGHAAARRFVEKSTLVRLPL